MSNIALETYKEYLVDIQKMVFKILPLTEEGNEYIYEYVDLVILEIAGMSSEIVDLPHGQWYARSLSLLKGLYEHVELLGDERDVKKTKKVTLKITNAIDRQLKEVNDLL